MPHITNKNQLLDVLTTDTFEQWRVKTNNLIHAYITLPADISDGSISDLKLGLNAAYNNIGAQFGSSVGSLIDSTKLSQSASVDNLNDYVQFNTIGSEVGLIGSVLRTGSVALNKLTIVNVAKPRILGTGSATSSVFTEIEVGTGLTISGTTIILATGAALNNITPSTIGSEKLAAGAALDNIIGGSIQFGKLNSSAVIDNINNRLSVVGLVPSSSYPLIGFSGQILNLNSIPLDRLYRTASTAYLLGASAGNSIANPVKELGLGGGLIIDSTKLSVLFGAGLAVESDTGTSFGSGTDLNKIYVYPTGFSDRSVPLAKLARSATTAYLLGNTSTGTQSVKELLLGIGLSVDTTTLNVNVKITPTNYNDLIANNSINYRKLTWTGLDVGTVDSIEKGTYPWSTGIVPATDIGILPLAKLERTVTAAAYLLGNTIGAATVTNNLSVNPVKELLLGTGLGISLAAPFTLNVLLGTGLAVVTDSGTDLNKIYVNPAGFSDKSVPLAKLARSATTAYLLGSTSTSTDVVKELGLGALRINTGNSTIGIISANLDINSVPLNKLERTAPFLATTNVQGAAYILGSTITTGAVAQNDLVTPAVQQLALTDGLAITTVTTGTPSTIGIALNTNSGLKFDSGLGINYNDHHFQVSSNQLALSTATANKVYRGTAFAWAVWNYYGITNSYNITSISHTSVVYNTAYSFDVSSLTFGNENGTLTNNKYIVLAHMIPNIFGSSSGAVERVILTFQGLRYTNGTHDLTFTGVGLNARGTYTVSGNVVVSVAITNGGSGYSTAPSVTFVNGYSSGHVAANNARGIAQMDPPDTDLSNITISSEGYEMVNLDHDTVRNLNIIQKSNSGVKVRTFDSSQFVQAPEDRDWEYYLNYFPRPSETYSVVIFA